MTVLRKLLHRSVTQLVRWACVLALVALTLMTYAVVSGRPLPVILAMSVGHLVGLTSFSCFFVAVLIDATCRDRRTDEVPHVEAPKHED